MQTLKLIHFTPSLEKRKELFPSFPAGTDNFCPLGRENSTQAVQGGEQETQKVRHQGGEAGQEAAHGGAEQEEIGQAAAEQGQGQVEPHPAPLQPGGAEEQQPEGPQPEEQVQQLLGPAGREQQAQKAQQVIG